MAVTLPVLTDEPIEFDALAGLDEGGQPEEGAEIAEEEYQDPNELLKVLQQKLSALEQKVGTDNDVAVVKSQRDRLKSDLDQVQTTLIPQVQAMAAELQNTRNQQAQGQIANYDAQVAAYLNGIQDPAQRQAETQRYAYERQQVMTALQIGQREQQLGQREQHIAQKEQGEAVGQLQKQIEDRYAQLAREAGVDPNALDKSSWESMHQSLVNGIKTRLTSQGRPVPTNPQRGSKSGSSPNLPDWFGKKMGQGKWGDLDALFAATMTQRGLRPRDIVSH